MNENEIRSFVNVSKLKLFWCQPDDDDYYDYSKYPSLTSYILFKPQSDQKTIETFGHQMVEFVILHEEETITNFPFDVLSSLARKLIYCQINIEGNGDFIFNRKYELPTITFLWIEVDKTNMDKIKFTNFIDRFPKLRGFYLEVKKPKEPKLDVDQWNEFARFHPKRHISIFLNGVKPTSLELENNLSVREVINRSN